jgi:hypothetical protein
MLNLHDALIYRKASMCSKENENIVFNTRKKLDKYYHIITSEDEFKSIVLDKFEKPKNISKSESGDSRNDGYIRILKRILDTNIYRNDKKSVHNTFKYVFYNHKLCYYAQIRNNKLKYFFLIDNINYESPYYEKIKENMPHNHNISDDKIKKAKVTQCLIRFDTKKFDTYKINFYYYEVLIMLLLLTSNHEVNDIDLFINYRDQNILKANLTEPFDNMVDQNNFPLKNHKYEHYAPIMSFAYRYEFIDIPIITPDDITRHVNGYITGVCKNGYYDNLDLETDWDKKITTAVFRGRGTGCGLDRYDNQRINISYLDDEWSTNPKMNAENKIDGVKFLDAGIIDISHRHKKLYHQRIKKTKPIVPLKKFMSLQDQSKHKYLIYIEGNSLAYRLGFMLKNKSVIIYVKSRYTPWFYYYLRHKKNCVMVKSDLSDLYDAILWLKKNDDKAQEIAENGYKLYRKHLTLNKMLEYMELSINYISNGIK